MASLDKRIDLLCAMEDILPASLECLDLETGIDWSSLPGSTAIRYLLQDCAWQCFHGNKDLAEQQSEELLDVTWEKLNTGHWKDVQIGWRHVFSYASLLKVLCICSKNPFTPKILQEALSACDRGLLMGAPIMNGILTQLASCLHASGVAMDTDSSNSQKCMESNEDCMEFKEQKCKRIKLDHHHEPTIHSDHEIPRVVTPSLSAFLVNNMEKESPVLIEQAMDHWPARSYRQWSLSYLRKIAGKRTVPVELGSKYTDDNWSQSLMTLQDFIDHHIDIEKDSRMNPRVGYLAQHQLFDQIPELKADICIPDYCCLHLPIASSKTPRKKRKASEIDDSQKIDYDREDERRFGKEGGMSSKGDGNETDPEENQDSVKDGEMIEEQKKERREEEREKTAMGERKNRGKKEEDEKKDQGKNEGKNQGVYRIVEGQERNQEEKEMEEEEEQGKEEEEQEEQEEEEEEEEEEEDIDINAWFGPAGTVSPLHFDPKHNLLCQVVGKKYIRLYSKDSTPLLYQHEGLLSNTSQVDVENVDDDVFPLFKQAPYQDCILSEGEMLYIPPGCWHYVRSLSLSFSVSFWWR